VTAGLQQLSQGLASNRLQGDELRSVFENLPLVAKALADELAGGSIAALREMGAQGELTGEVVSEALLKAREEAKRLAEALPDTTERAANRVANAWSNAIAEILKAVGGTSGVTEAYNSVARGIQKVTETIGNNAELVKDSIEALGPAFIWAFGTIGVQQLALVGAALGTLIKQIATAKLTMTAFASPGVAVAIGVIAGAVALVANRFKDSRLETEAATRAVEEYIRTVDEKDAQELRRDIDQLERAREAQEEKFLKAAEKLRDKEIELQTMERSLNQARMGIESDAQRRLIQRLEEKVEKLEEATSAGEELNSTFLETKKELEETAEKLAVARNRLGELEGAASDAKREADAVAKSMDDMEDGARGAADGVDELNRILDRLTPKLGEMAQNAADIDSVWALFDAGKIGSGQAIDLITRLEAPIEAWTELMSGAAMRGAQSGPFPSGFLDDAYLNRLKQVAPAVRDAAAEMGTYESLVLAVATAESRLVQTARSHAGAGGIMQFMPETAKIVALQMKAANKEINITADDIRNKFVPGLRAGAHHLQDLIDTYGGLYQALIGYNMGHLK